MSLIADREWVRVRRSLFMGNDFPTAPHMFTPSYHLFKTFTRVSGRAITLCGRSADADTVVDELPGGTRSCENCLRLAVK